MPVDLRKTIFVTFQREGIHCFPAAATDPRYATGDEYDVSFLATPHRHIFHFKVRIDVKHDDRDIEFIQFKRWLEGLYGKGTLQLDNKSCEMICDDIAEAVNNKYGYTNSVLEVEVSEDGENGSIKSYLLGS
jgi:hypothetical protein